MRFFSALFFLTFILPLSVFAQPAKKDTIINVLDSLGRKQGVWKKLYRTGQLGYEGAFKNDIPVGKFTYYYDDGSIKSVTVFSKNGKNARSKFYYPKGGIWGEGKYKGGEVKDSVWRYYSEKGVLILEETYLDGKKNGPCRKYYDNTKLLEEKTYKNGVEDGPWKQYFISGQLKINGRYSNGFLEGKIQFFNPDGKLYATGAYQHAVKHGEWIYYDTNGTIKQRQDWKFGKFQGDEKELMINPIDQQKEKEKYEREHPAEKNNQGDEFDRQIPR